MSLGCCMVCVVVEEEVGVDIYSLTIELTPRRDVISWNVADQVLLIDVRLLLVSTIYHHRSYHRAHLGCAEP